MDMPTLVHILIHVHLNECLHVHVNTILAEFNAKNVVLDLNRRNGNKTLMLGHSNANLAIAMDILINVYTAKKLMKRVNHLTFMEYTKVVEFVKIVVTTHKESIVTNVNHDTIDHTENIGMRLTFVNLVIVIISIRLEIVQKRLVIVSAELNSKHQTVTHVLRDISAIQTVDHVNVISMEHKEDIAKQSMENVRAKKTLAAISVKNVHLVTLDILNVKIVNVNQLDQ
jgi:hypothetical protein